MFCEAWEPDVADVSDHSPDAGHEITDALNLSFLHSGR